MIRNISIALLMFLALATALGAQQTEEVYYLNPDWSPDGRTILFESTKDGKFGLFTIKADGTGLRKLSSGNANDEQARWSPDGLTIVFISDEGGSSQIYIMNADGSGRRRLTDAREFAFLPEFSPSGKQIAFQSSPDRQGVQPDIYVINVNGSGRMKLTDGRAEYTAPRWSPDGRRIMYTCTELISQEKLANFPKMTREERRKIIDEKNSSSEIYLMKRDGTEKKNLTNNRVSDSIVRWSRDGSSIFFHSIRDGTLQAFSMRWDGSNVQRADDASVVAGSSMSRDGTFIVYAKEVNRKWGIYIYEVKARRERFLTGAR
jgi:Tol biopolymer transport system component